MAGASPVQTQEDLVPPAPAAIGYRLAGVVLAPAVAVAIHVVLTGPFGLALQTQPPGADGLQDLPLLTTALFTLGIGLVGWLSVVLLTRSLGEEKGRRIWMTVAFAVLAVSIVPIAFLDIGLGAQIGMVVLHAVVAVVLIPTLSSQSPAEPLHRDS